MTLEDQLNALAQSLVRDADTDMEMPVKDKVDIFKAAATWYLGLRKGQKQDDDAPGESFENLRNRINGKGAVQ
jgi:hypothetical protein